MLTLTVLLKYIFVAIVRSVQKGAAWHFASQCIWCLYVLQLVFLSCTSQVFAGLTTLRKLCNHPDLVTNDYSQLVTPGNRGRKGSTHRVVKAVVPVAGGAGEEEEEEREEDQEFVMVDAAARIDDEGVFCSAFLPGSFVPLMVCLMVHPYV